MIPLERTHSPNGDAISAKATPDTTTNEIRQARRKIQNRVNQRAFRSRAKDKKAADGSTANPFRVHRWRVDDGNDDMPALKPKADAKAVKRKSALSSPPALGDPPSQAEEPPSSDESHSHRALVSIPAATSPAKRSAPWLNLSYCLLSDHLLHLIHFNVLRGLSYNKKFLEPCAFSKCSSTPSITLKRILPHIPDESILRALRLPENLTPTSLQLSCRHSSWIDVFPFPEMRDNLIRSCDSPARMANALPGSKDHDDAPDRRGLILWGEPYQRESWEVTPGFLRKWWWVVKGCGGLIDSTNRWRTVRGERPLRMAILSQ